MLRTGNGYPSQLIRELRTVVSEPRRWLLLVGNRFLLAGFLTVTFALSVLALMAVEVVNVWAVTPMVYLFSTLTGGNITLVTIVLSINQIVLSREFRTPGDLHGELEAVVDYRHRVEETAVRDAAPPTPSEFLLALIAGMRTNAQRFGGVVRGLGYDSLTDATEPIVSALSSHADTVREGMNESQRGIFHTLVLVLETNYSQELSELSQIRTDYEDRLSPMARDSLEELTTTLKQIDIARQYFKSVYVQAELARLSRVLLLVGVPAVSGTILMLFVYSGVAGRGMGTAVLPIAVLLAVTLAFTPLAVLFAVVLRIATVAERTVAITPFTIPRQESASELADE